MRLYKRKKQGKTNYKKRLTLLKSNKFRLVIRRTLKNIIIQIIQYSQEGDKVLVSSHSNQLKRLGWKFHKGNLPSAYLTGLLCGKKAKRKNIKEAILDLGLNPSIKSSAHYAALKGLIDSELKVHYSENILPSQDRISGKHISEDVQKNFQEIKEKILKENEK